MGGGESKIKNEDDEGGGVGEVSKFVGLEKISKKEED